MPNASTLKALRCDVFRNLASESSKSFRLTREVLAITRVGAKELAVTIPKEAIITVSSTHGTSNRGMICVRWRDEYYAMFAIDLAERGEEWKSQNAAQVYGIRKMTSCIR